VAHRKIHWRVVWTSEWSGVTMLWRFWVGQACSMIWWRLSWPGESSGGTVQRLVRHRHAYLVCTVYHMVRYIWEYLAKLLEKSVRAGPLDDLMPLSKAWWIIQCWVSQQGFSPMVGCFLMPTYVCSLAYLELYWIPERYMRGIEEGLGGLRVKKIA
jgi:hypothetical protein